MPDDAEPGNPQTRLSTRTSAPSLAAGRTPAVPVILVVLTSLIGTLLILSHWTRGRAYLDQMRFHEQVIRTFGIQWPRPDLHDYASATTPGYHLALTAFGHWFNGSRTTLQFVSLGISLALVWLFGSAIARRAAARGIDWPTALAVALPFVLSPYVIMSDAWLLPDNAGWLGVLFMLLLALRPQYRWIDALAGGLVLAALVFTRQNHLWCAGLIWLWSWLASGPFDRWSLNQLLARSYERMVGAAWAVVFSLPAFAIVAYFFKLWQQGLTPPHFRDQHAGGNAATPAFSFSLIALYSMFFVAWLWPALVRLWREQRLLVIATAAAGLVVAIIPETTYLREPRSSGLWNIVKFLDDHKLTIAGRTSPLILLLSPIGAICLAAWLSLLNARDRAIFLAALAGFTIAQSFNANAWQRYLEPMFLIVLALMAAGSPPSSDAWSHRLRPFRLAGPALLSVILAAATIHLLTQDMEPEWRKTYEMQAAIDPMVVR